MKYFLICALILVLAVVYAESVCVHNGIEYKVGESYKDDCNTCSCGKNGKGGCTRRGCPPKVCRYNGKKYGKGERFMDADGCNTCTCTGKGDPICTLMLCV